MNVNMLKLNEDTTEFLVIRSKHLSQQTLEITTLQVGDERVPAESSVRNIGPLLDNKLNMTVIKQHTLIFATYHEFIDI